MTAERLLQAAHELLYERAGRSASLNEICTRAGANVAMIKYCFGNKDGLLDALIHRVMPLLSAEVQRLAALDLPPEEKLRRHIAGLIRNYVRYPYINRLMDERLRGSNEETVERMSAAFALPAHAWYAELLAEGRRTAGWREVDPTCFFFQLIGTCEFVFAARAWLEGAFATPLDETFLERFSTQAAELILGGLRDAS